MRAWLRSWDEWLPELPGVLYLAAGCLVVAASLVAVVLSLLGVKP